MKVAQTFEYQKCEHCEKNHQVLKQTLRNVILIYGYNIQLFSNNFNVYFFENEKY